MLENLTLPIIFPVGVVLFDFLFLLIAIPIEAYVFSYKLKFDKRTSTFYAISTNLFSSVIGWLVFFLAEPMLPITLKSELINYVFFNSFKSASSQTFFILTAFIIFFATFIMKFFILRVLLISLREELWKKEEEEKPFQRRRASRFSTAKLQNTNLVTATLIANSLSYSAITLVLFIRSR